jgi:hypothetical protein
MSKGKHRKRTSINDLEHHKNQSMMFKFLEKNKGVVIFVLAVVLIEIVNIILTFLMAFKLI